MNCHACGRELKDDARFCDFCGAKVPEQEQQYENGLNKKLLLTGLLASIGVTVAITMIAMGFGLPLFFGGLFLPFFFVKKKKKQGQD